MRRTLFEDEHDAFRSSFRKFVDKEIVPYRDEWERAGNTVRGLFRSAGDLGFLGRMCPRKRN